VDERTGTETRDVMAVPLVWGGDVRGVMEVGNRDPALGEFTDEHLAHAHAIGAIVAGWLAPRRRPPAAGRTAPGSEGVPRETLIVGTHPSICRILDVVSRVAPTDDPVLILGETGTGKELVARRIHDQSQRNGHSFMVVNCAAIAETLMESEMFGHVKGAFTDARTDRPGSFVLADGGTLFLDEIADLSPACQAKLLRALDEGEITPVGGSSPRRVDVRVVVATNRNLAEEVRGGTFRRDLYYRLRGFELELPPLRERTEDIPLLCEYFLRRAAMKKGKRIAGIESALAERLREHDWPGNVRELRHLVDAMVTLAQGECIGAGDVPPFARKLLDQRKGSEVQTPATTAGRVDRHEDPRSAERTKILDALTRTAFPSTGRWNVAKAARALAVPRTTLEYRIRRVYRLMEG
jgi:transcriptional regulator with GAF, ATPase, and Fis domain